MIPKRLNNIFPVIVTLLLYAFANYEGYTSDSKKLKEYLTNLPFTMPDLSEPTFPEYKVNILDYGAVADGRTMNTKAFADAIDACSKAGGGSVIVPPGTWLTGPIRLESNVNLYLERGALVQFSNRYEDFPLIPSLDGKTHYQITPPIYAYRAKNIAITGNGIFDGAGEAWRYVKKEKQTASQWEKLIKSGGVVTKDGKQWWPSREAMEGEKYLQERERAGKKLSQEDYARVREYLRPDLVRLIQCNGILIDGPTFRNSPRFHLYPIQSENIIIRNVKVITDWFAQNGDGIDLGSCRNVVIYNATVDVGDDAICLKPGTIAENQSPGPACENIVIADCVVYHGHGGFVIGSETIGGARNISVRNCIFIGTDVGLRFKSARGRGGLIENVFIDGIQMRAIENEAILFDMYYNEGSPEKRAEKKFYTYENESVTNLTPQFRNVSISNIVCNGANRAILLNGLPEMHLKNIQFENLSISSKNGALLIDCDSVSLKNVYIKPERGSVATLYQCKNIFLERISYPTGIEVFLNVNGEKSTNIQLSNIDFSGSLKGIEYNRGAKKDAVVFK